jgi:enoyl-CoA hydratase/carnithine racemase
VAELVDAVMRSAPQATRQTKALLRNIRPLPDSALWAACSHANAQARLSSEAREGLQAFLAKRTPSWAENPGNRSDRKR